MSYSCEQTIIELLQTNGACSMGQISRECKESATDYENGQAAVSVHDLIRAKVLQSTIDEAGLTVYEIVPDTIPESLIGFSVPSIEHSLIKIWYHSHIGVDFDFWLEYVAQDVTEQYHEEAKQVLSIRKKRLTV